MSDYQYIIEQYKNNARAKNVNVKDVIIYAIGRSLVYGESIGEQNYLAGKYLFRAFVPSTHENTLRHQLNNDGYSTLKKYLDEIRRGQYSNIYDWCDDTTQQNIRGMANHLIEILHRNYVYVLVREDLEIYEQCVVQAAHATFVAGHHIRTDIMAGKYRCNNFDPKKTHFVIAGAKDLNSLASEYYMAVDKGYVVYPFFEEDLRGEMTAFAVQPIQQPNRRDFGHYQLLKFGGNDGQPY